MPARDPGRIVITQMDRALGVLPDQRLERQVDARRLRRLHQGRSGYRIAEYHQRRRPQREPGTGSAGGVIDLGEHSNALCPECLQKLIERRFEVMRAAPRDETVYDHGYRSTLPIGLNRAVGGSQKEPKTERPSVTPPADFLGSLARRIAGIAFGFLLGQ